MAEENSGGWGFPLFAFGFVVGMMFSVGMDIFTGGALARARYEYERCLADGGTNEHCAQKYLIGETKP